MSILITGAAGFIGFHLCKRLLAAGKEIIGIDNLNDYYDSSLKKDRLKILQNIKKDKFTFIKMNIDNKKDLFEIFEKFLPELDYLEDGNQAV